MAGINIRKFLGIAPKVSPELLPDTMAQVARNTKLYSGDLIPAPESVVIGNSGRPAGTKTLYGIANPETGALAWLTWDKVVDVAIVTTEEGSEFRFFYTGDGPPKYSTYDLAVSGPPPHPNAGYNLGLPLPKEKPTTTKIAFTEIGIASYSRDANGIITLNTAGPHKLKDKALVTITGFTFKEGTYTVAGTAVTTTINNHGLSGTPNLPLTFLSGKAVSGTYQAAIVDGNVFTTVDASTPTPADPGGVRLGMGSFNATSLIATAVDADTITYQSAGFEMALRSDQPAVKVKLGGSDIPRTYVYTWYNEWEEESIASKPSDIIYVKEGDTVIVGSLPASFNDPAYSVQGIRLYRSAGTASTGDYLLLQTLWWPKPVISYKRSGGLATVEFATMHHMIKEDRFRLIGLSDGSFDVSDGVVVDVPDETHMTYASAGGDVARTPSGSGHLFYDIAENALLNPPVYWGWNNDYTFTDNFDSLNLETVLQSDQYEEPPPTLEGIITAQNGILAGFVGNTVYFSLPYKPHAWPNDYAITLDYDVIALSVMSGTIIVLTTGYPFLISGNDPASMSTRRIDALYPCVSRGSVVSMNYGVVYSTHDGLAVISTQLSSQLVTKALFNNDTWHADIDPHDLAAEFYGDAYVASWPGGSFTFEPGAGEQAAPYFVDFDPKFSAPWYDPISGALYYAQIDNASIWEWGPTGGVPLPQGWKSKVFKTPNMINLGAGRIIADFPEIGRIGILDREIDFGWLKFPYSRQAVTPTVSVSLWANKKLIATIQIGDDGIFRLPSGYRTDTFEVSVVSNIRVRAIHLAETPYELRKV